MTFSNPMKAVIGLLVAFAATIGGARLASEASMTPDGQVSAAPWAQHSMDYIAWNGLRWTAWIRDGNFELLPETEGNWHRHANTTLAYIGWDGEPMQARIQGEHFVIAHRGEWHGSVEEANAIRYRDWEGANRIRTVTQLTR